MKDKKLRRELELYGETFSGRKLRVRDLRRRSPSLEEAAFREIVEASNGIDERIDEGQLASHSVEQFGEEVIDIINEFEARGRR